MSGGIWVRDQFRVLISYAVCDWRVLLPDLGCLGDLRGETADVANFWLSGWMLLQGLGPYSTSIKKVEKEIKEMAKKINDLCGE